MTLIALLVIHGNALYRNPAYRSVFGDDVDLKSVDGFAQIHPGDRERVRQAFNDIVRRGTGQRLQFRFQLADGSVRHIQSGANALYGPDGQVDRVVILSRDVTE